MRKTENLELNKPEYADEADIAVINANMDKLDTALKEIETEAKNKDGGNADTVDGKHASDFAAYGIMETGGDFNNMTAPGIYAMRNPTANKPPNSGSYFGLIVLKSDTGDFVEQIAFQENSYKIYIRTFGDSSGWSPWEKINDGGNADTVDGKHASDFALAEDMEDVNKITLKNKIASAVFEETSVSADNRTITVEGVTSRNDLIGVPIHIRAKADGAEGSCYLQINDFDRLQIALKHFKDDGGFGIYYQLPDLWIKNGYIYTVIYEETPSVSNPSLKIASLTLLDNPEVLNSAITDASTSEKGIVRLTDSVSSTSVTTAATPNAVKQVYDLAKGKAEKEHTHTKSQITDFPASLPANGGNADTVSGVDISEIQLKQTGMSSYTDWNDIVEPGFHKLMEPHTANEPNSGDWFFPVVFAYDSSGITQLAVSYRYDWIYIRHRKKTDNNVWDWTKWTKVSGAFEQIEKTSQTDLDTLCGSTALYNLQGNFTGGPDGIGSWGSLLSLYGTGSGKTVQVYFPDTGSAAYIRRCTSGGESRTEWKYMGDGCNAASVNKKVVNFTSAQGWHRVAKGAILSGGSCACGVMTLMGTGNGARCSAVISVSQCGTEGSLNLLNYNSNNGFFNKFRMVRGTDNYMYIDASCWSAGGNSTFTFTFSGMGWQACDNIVSVNSDYGEEVQLIEI